MLRKPVHTMLVLVLLTCVSSMRVYGQEAGRQLAVKTNLLYDAALVPNVGVEYHFGNGWSAGADWNCAWWADEGRNRFWRIYGGELEVRRYFGGKREGRPLSGHHVGAYCQGFTYDFALSPNRGGQISELTYGTGVSYGYALPVAKSLNLDFCLGFGYLGGDYKVYVPQDGCYVWQETRGRNYFGPSKFEISLVWLIGLHKKEECR